MMRAREFEGGTSMRGRGWVGPRSAPAVLVVTVLLLAAEPAGAQEASSGGDLTGGIDPVVWLLVPLVLLVAVVTALALAAPADETSGSNRSGGVSRALARGATPSVPAATPISTEEQP
jgi:hypothetical protein